MTLAAGVRKSEFYNFLRPIRVVPVPIWVQGEEVFFPKALLTLLIKIMFLTNEKPIYTSLSTSKYVIKTDNYRLESLPDLECKG